ncbi:hypothetical protein KC878_04195 [Candidatus Saccharibacteria bacterium]|nr:hypothetical protein [Candidatus Saccharibacteria bacterium]MCB9821098.1 hypothetical protein [Candidatus Nomurabacteria bacterium]
MGEHNSKTRPTKKQKELLDFIAQFIEEHGYSPSYREIMSGCSYNSVATVAAHVNNLIKRGHLVKRLNSARSLEVVGGAQADSVSSASNMSGKAWFVGQVANHFHASDNIDDLYVLLGSLKILGLSKEFEEFKQRLLKLDRHD